MCIYFLLAFLASHSLTRFLPILIITTVVYYPLPSRLFTDNLQHWLRDLARLLMVQFTSNKVMSNDAPYVSVKIDHYTGNLLFTNSLWVPLVPYRIRCQACETGPTVYRRRLENLTVCRCHYEGSTFSSVSLRPRVLARPWLEPAASPVPSHPTELNGRRLVFR